MQRTVQALDLYLESSSNTALQPFDVLVGSLMAVEMCPF